MTGPTPAEQRDPDPVGRQGWSSGRSPSPPNGFAAGIGDLDTETLQTVVLEHVPDGLGHCTVCGEEWTCPSRLRAAAELRRRGVERPILDNP